jgi:hypothetical protein
LATPDCTDGLDGDDDDESSWVDDGAHRHSALSTRS